MQLILANYQEAERIDGEDFNWTPHRDKIPCYPGFLDAVSSPWFISQCYDADPYIGNGILTGRNKLGERFGVIDFDDRRLYEDFVSRVRIETTVALTRRGAHVYVRGEMPNRIRVGKQPIDLISQRKFVAAPLSDGPTAGFQREWLTPLRPVHRLAEFDAAWLPEISIQPQQKPKSSPLVSQSEQWAWKTLTEEYYSIEGSGGDLALFRAACFLIQRAKLDYRTALTMLMQWNGDGIHAVPPWPESRLRYKLDEAQRLMK